MCYFPVHLRRVARNFDQPWSIIESVIANQPHAAERDLHLPVARCELPDGIQLAYADDCGRRHAIALDEAAAVDFGRVRAFRRPSAELGTSTRNSWRTPAESCLNLTDCVKIRANLRFFLSVAARIILNFCTRGNFCARGTAHESHPFPSAVPQLLRQPGLDHFR